MLCCNAAPSFHLCLGHLPSSSESHSIASGGAKSRLQPFVQQLQHRHEPSTAVTMPAAALSCSCVGLACPGQMSASKFQDQAWRLGDMDRDESGAASKPPASARSDTRKPAPDKRSGDRSRDSSRGSRGDDVGKNGSRSDDGRTKGSDRVGGGK